MIIVSKLPYLLLNYHIVKKKYHIVKKISSELFKKNMLVNYLF
jgi:hypothetical protein